MARAMRTVRHPQAQRDQLMQDVTAVYVQFEKESEAASTLSERMTLFYGPDGIVANGFYKVVPLLLPPVAVGMASFNLLAKFSKDLPADAPNPLVLTRGLPHNVTTEMDLMLWQTAQTIRADEGATAVFERETAEKLADAYLSERLPLCAQTAVFQFMVQYGMRGLAEIDIGQPRWRENPTHIMQVLQSYLKIDDPEMAPDRMFARGEGASRSGD